VNENEYLKKHKEKIRIDWNQINGFEGVRLSTVFRPNYDLIVSHIFVEKK
jgi:hypothetical protein